MKFLLLIATAAALASCAPSKPSTTGPQGHFGPGWTERRMNYPEHLKP